LGRRVGTEKKCTQYYVNPTGSFHIYSMFENELYFKTSRSGGSGGQHVNKVSTKVELNFNVALSKQLTFEQKQKIAERLSHRINKEGVLKVRCDSTRSQLENKQLSIHKFIQLIEECLKEKKKRIRTKATKQSKEKRIQSKKIRSEKKRMRKNSF
jgi:ribosome-associated protein